MKPYSWNNEKNERLKQERGISFDDVLDAIDRGGLLDDYRHPNQTTYPGQHIMIVRMKEYVYLVPYIEDKEKYFFKTIVPSRKAKKKYLSKRKESL